MEGNNGFPSPIQLQCPVFLQDKYKYIEDLIALGIETIPTLRIPIMSVENGLSDEYSEQIWRYIIR